MLHTATAAMWDSVTFTQNSGTVPYCQPNKSGPHVINVLPGNPF